MDYTQTFMLSESESKQDLTKKCEKKGAKGAPTAKQFKRAAKTAKKR